MKKTLAIILSIIIILLLGFLIYLGISVNNKLEEMNTKINSIDSNVSSTNIRINQIRRKLGIGDLLTFQ